MPKRMELGSSASSGALFKEEISNKVETAEKFVKKVWNAKKGRFDYIYPEDLERQKTKLARETMKASETGDIPKSMRIGGPAEKIKGGKADNIPDSMFKKRDLNIGKKVESEHSKNKAQQKEIAKDHIVEHGKIDASGKIKSNYYPKLKEMEKKLETADNVEVASEYGGEENKREGNYKGGKKGRQWKWSDHKYRARVGPKGDYRYNYTQSQKVPESEAIAERKMAKEQKDTDKKAETSTKGRLPLSGELQNPGAQASKAAAGFRGRAPAATMPPQGRARHMQSAQTQMHQVKMPRQDGSGPHGIGMGPGQGKADGSGLGMGLHQQQQGAGNPVNTGFNMEKAPQKMGGVISNMADQAKSQGNVYDSRKIGQDNIPRQRTLANPFASIKDPAKLRNSYNLCSQMASKTGGVCYTTADSNAGLFSIVIHPDRTVYDPTLGINGMPLDRYLSLIPYSFIPSA